VAVTRATRAHEDIRQGSSVRGAIDLTLVAGQLFTLAPERLPVSSGPSAALPGQGKAAGEAYQSPGPARDAAGPLAAGELPPGPARDTPEWDEAAEQSYRETVYDAMVVALSGRIFLDETVEASPEQVLRQIWEDHFILAPAAATPG
jgi:MoxR-like ATPase